MKKIGIITYQRAHNYGAILQCLALQEFIKENADVSVSIIDYKPKFLKYYNYFLLSRFSLKHPVIFIKEIFFFRRRYKRFCAFDNFISKYLMLNKDYSDNLSEYDVIIIGSDQLWNINNTDGIFDKMYWGNFKTDNKPRLITYAVSMGGCVNIDWTCVKKNVLNFQSISVREKYLQDNLKQYADCKSQWVLDPTLLQNRSFWLKLTVSVKPTCPYLFYYQARNKPLALQYAKEAAKKMNLEFIYVSAHIMLPNSREGIAANPIEFLNLLRNAKYVITSSFHGTVFCIQFHKDFSTLLLNDGEDGRSLSLLHSLGLSNHLVTLTEPICGCPTNWQDVDKVLENQREKSKNWLLNNI